VDPLNYIVRVDDWEAFYIDGKLVDQGHSLDLVEVLRLLKIDVHSVYLEPDPDDGDGEWYFADKLEDVKFEPYED
jgi:hypothetical protein